MNAFRVSKGFDLDHDRPSVGLNLGPSCLPLARKGLINYKCTYNYKRKCRTLKGKYKKVIPNCPSYNELFELTLCVFGNFACFLSSADSFHNQLFEKFFQCFVVRFL